MKEIFQEEEWALLCETPAIVLNVVGSADGKIDKKELEAFEHFTKRKNAFASQLFNLILPEKPEKLIEKVVQKKYDKNELKEKLRTVDNILDNKVDAIDAKLFKHHLIALGTYIANASGKMFSEKISEEENESLVTLGKYIDVDVNHLFRSTLIDEILKKL